MPKSDSISFFISSSRRVPIQPIYILLFAIYVIFPKQCVFTKSSNYKRQKAENKNNHHTTIIKKKPEQNSPSSSTRAFFRSRVPSGNSEPGKVPSFPCGVGMHVCVYVSARVGKSPPILDGESSGILDSHDDDGGNVYFRPCVLCARRAKVLGFSVSLPIRFFFLFVSCYVPTWMALLREGESFATKMRTKKNGFLYDTAHVDGGPLWLTTDCDSSWFYVVVFETE